MVRIEIAAYVFNISYTEKVEFSKKKRKKASFAPKLTMKTDLILKLNHCLVPSILLAWSCIEVFAGKMFLNPGKILVKSSNSVFSNFCMNLG